MVTCSIWCHALRSEGHPAWCRDAGVGEGRSATSWRAFVASIERYVGSWRREALRHHLLGKLWMPDVIGSTLSGTTC